MNFARRALGARWRLARWETAPIVVVVHDTEARFHGRNAHYLDYGIIFNDDHLHVGDGGGDMLPLSAAFDVMAHELAHGITNRTSQPGPSALMPFYGHISRVHPAKWTTNTAEGRS